MLKIKDEIINVLVDPFIKRDDRTRAIYPNAPSPLRERAGVRVLFFLLFISTLATAQQEASVQVVVRPLQDKVMLRWAVDQPNAWKKANQYGFLVERITISRNGEAVLPKESQMLTATALKPKPLMEWEPLAKKDQNAAVIAQSLYGETFAVDAMNTMESVVAINKELEQRFTFGLVAAEQSYEAALFAGWGLIDTEAKKGEKYLYKVSVAIPPEESIKINEGSVFTSLDLYEELPKPIGLAGDFGDSNVVLSWNFNLLQSIYTNYIVERSEDKIKYTPLSGSPVFNAQQPKDAPSYSLFYNDSIPNDKMFYYRVKGKTTFGEMGPPSDILEGKAEKGLNFLPHISQKQIPDNNTVILDWKFPKEANELITGFELRRSNKNDGPFTTVKDGILPTARTITYKGLKRINYFVIVAKAKNGAESESFPSIVQPIDSIPPKPPVGLSGVIDTTGVVQLSWTPNTEEDMLGYRVYRANNPNAEFTQITRSEVRDNQYTDTIAVKNMNKKIYYKITAEDQRYNASDLSEMLAIDKPDLTPPSPAVISKYEVTKEGVQVVWIPSSSDDVMAHIVYRKDMSVAGGLWENIIEKTNITDTTYVDKSAEQNKVYSYTVMAKDTSGLESSPATPIEVTIAPKTIEAEDIKFSGVANRELRYIQLSWKVKNDAIAEYRLYRGDGDKKLQLFKTFEGTKDTYKDTELEAGSEYTYGLQVLVKGSTPSVLKKITVKY
ncbi:fibronectin type III domain-containing protein [Aquimarina mytili]|uniref:Fibronectin type-III domain-containing protein n=1 Tax=Aquimarina mytili TaxID=874423 RepID=A0A936ZVW3_9FLAO|nr:hypothetical protein [Aquimarina mytili]MBL0685267.1 hypothetical protein [Aquimarina mytili]